MRQPFQWNLGRRSLELGRRTLVMGVVNVTPDSFSDGGQFLSPECALERALQLLGEGADILDLSYDGLVKDPKPVVEQMLAFLALEWDERCLSAPQTARAVKTASVWQVREPLYQRSSGRARHYERQLSALRDYLYHPQ